MLGASPAKHNPHTTTPVGSRQGASPLAWGSEGFPQKASRRLSRIAHSRRNAVDGDQQRGQRGRFFVTSAQAAQQFHL